MVREPAAWLLLPVLPGVHLHLWSAGVWLGLSRLICGWGSKGHCIAGLVPSAPAQASPGWSQVSRSPEEGKPLPKSHSLLFCWPKEVVPSPDTGRPDGESCIPVLGEAAVTWQRAWTLAGEEAAVGNGRSLQDVTQLSSLLSGSYSVATLLSCGSCSSGGQKHRSWIPGQCGGDWGRNTGAQLWGKEGKGLWDDPRVEVQGEMRSVLQEPGSGP